jgi:hypothetical protein
MIDATGARIKHIDHPAFGERTETDRGGTSCSASTGEVEFKITPEKVD